MIEYKTDEDYKASQPFSCDESDNSEYEFEMNSKNQYYGRWAAEKWLLRLYFWRCCRFLLSKFRPAKPANSASDEPDKPPF